ncbi:ZEB2-regulated ABC transporter 1 [Lachnellula arida]|uniref:ZEB2-regulated ABC transporter 1 n=1 Tax=Lachnellula arida TaxID=1316785 RepID=A0A8T9B260_9HELO|nr:ZEB2-regulated ABC transporter 1 [Lachnellula arida]
MPETDVVATTKFKSNPTGWDMDELQNPKVGTGNVQEISIAFTAKREGSVVSERGDSLHEASPTVELHRRKSNYEIWLSKRYEDPTVSHRSKIGVAYQDLDVFGFGTPEDYQKTFSNYPVSYFSLIRQFFGRNQNVRIDILKEFEGLVRSGEMLMVLGKPGSGCTTLLKTLAGQTHGLHIDPTSQLNYEGIPSNIMHSEFRGECNYQAESDVHFPHLTVGQTLAVAAQARTSESALMESSRTTFAMDTALATAAALGLSHVLHTKIGNEFIQGISGGERQRTSIAEILVCNTSLQCWDNSTRGLDSANALNFINTLRVSSKITGSTHIVAMYQASQEMYNIFDKVVLLYEGRQIFFGAADAAKSYFNDLGFDNPDRAATGDFLTSLTNPGERVHFVRKGFEDKVPRTPGEFAEAWKGSKQRSELLSEIRRYGEEFPLGLDQLQALRQIRKADKADGQRVRSPYTIKFWDQVKLCLWRGHQRLVNDLAPFISGIAGNAIISIILGSIFYDMPEDTSSFYGRGALIFFTVLMNTFLGNFEGVQLWAQRPIVEKHFQYALYHPTAEAIASIVCDIPNKLLLTTFFNVPFYFLANMRRTTSAFFTFYLFAFVILVTGSMLFRTIGAMSKTLTGSIAPGADFVLLLVIYTGFVLPIPSMHPWFRWFGYINPVSYVFESLMINEFSGRQFPCKTFVPQGPRYQEVEFGEKMCSVVGAVMGSSMVGGNEYLASTYRYYPEHKWRNLGIILSIGVLLCGMYLIATECLSVQRSKGEVLIYRRGRLPTKGKNDEETLRPNEHYITEKAEVQTPLSLLPVPSPEAHAATFLWDNLSYDVKIKGGTKRVLDDIEGWIKPGALTALMGSSGAGKTTLLNVLANRATVGVISGEKLVDAKFRDEGFARKVGYAQQQDLHLATSTVREALVFSARLHQPQSYSDAEKLKWVEHLIHTLDMASFAEAVIGVPGEGLNIEQRKRVTIGVELAGRPELLLFLDEPTSGLDSNTAWSICKLLQKLAREGQDILCTIHQPSGTLFQMFDRLLFLHEGKSVYFGELGPGCRNLIDYFESNGARKCEIDENPAEWLLEITGNSKTLWSQTWRKSKERQRVKQDLEVLKKDLSRSTTQLEGSSATEFATSFVYQLYLVTRRNFENDWRTPGDLYSKILLTLGAALVNGFSFYKSKSSIQGVQNQIFSTFLFLTLHSNLVQIIMPHFLKNRALYEIRERPSRTYSWTVFILSNMIAELPWQTLLAVIQFATWYYPVGMYKNAEATGMLEERSGLMFLIIWSFFCFSSTFSQMLGTIMPDAATGVNISSLLYSLSLIFCGVLVPPNALPRFWIFMYRSTPVTYFINTMVSTGIAGVQVTCAENELLHFSPPVGQNCSSYLEPYMIYGGGNLLNPNATTSGCQFCPIKDTDAFLRPLGMHFNERWRDFGISLSYSVINILGALFLYWLFRVPAKLRVKSKK